MGLLDGFSGWLNDNTQQPGLLSGLTKGQWSDDPMKNKAVGQGLMALGLNLLSSRGPFGQALGQSGLQGMQAYEGSLQGQQKQKLQDAQLADLQQQALLRKAQADKQNRLLDSITQWSNPGASDFQAGQAALGAAKTSGSAPGPTTQTAALLPQAQQQVQQSDPLNGVPRQAISADLAFNEGKGLADMIYKRGVPNIDFVNGVAMDKNRVTPGTSVPQISQNGQASQLVADQSAPGGYRVIPPNGALETYGAYRAADEAAKAKSDLIKVYDQASQREVFVPRSYVLGQAPQGAAPNQGIQPGRAGSPEAAASAETPDSLREQIRMVQTNGGQPITPQIKPAIDAEVARLTSRLAQVGGQPAGAGMAAGPSSAEAAQAGAAKTYAEGTAKDTVDLRKAIMNADFTAPAKLAKLNYISDLLKNFEGGSLSPKGMQFASAANSIGLNLDKNLPNKEAATALSREMALQLRDPSSGGGMPGSMSDADRGYLSSMAPGIEQTAEGRRKIIGAQTALIQRQQQVAQFARNYEKKYGRLDNGFFTQLQSWSNQNSMFKP